MYVNLSWSGLHQDVYNLDFWLIKVKNNPYNVENIPYFETYWNWPTHLFTHKNYEIIRHKTLVYKLNMDLENIK